MKKVGIVTLNGNGNFGNKLQNYALQLIIEKMNCVVVTLWPMRFNEILKKQIKKIVFKLPKFRRNNNFSKFTSKYIKLLHNINNKRISQFDYFVAGSDQIWNYTFPTYNKDMFLSFSDKNRNVSYAASFGVDNIPNEKIEEFRIGLNNFNYISVREERGKELVEELTGRDDAIVVLDPTMLLDAEDWKLISNKPRKLKSNKYILNYFLGQLSENRKKQIYKFAEENNCEVINILDKNSPFYESGPSEFLYLEQNAFLVCTDSFHSCVFAILFNRPFLVFEREDSNLNMNSRIETLLSKFNLQNRIYKNRISKHDLVCDYAETNKILEIERQKSMEFLKKSLNIK